MLKQITVTTLLFMAPFAITQSSFIQIVGAQGNSGVKEIKGGSNNNGTSTDVGKGIGEEMSSEHNNNSGDDVTSDPTPNSHAVDNANSNSVVNSADSTTANNETINVTTEGVDDNSDGNGGSKSNRSSHKNNSSSAVSSVEVKSGKTTGGNNSKSNFDRQLSLGTNGNDVKRLQEFLNSDPDTALTLTGTGSKGNETGYYGPLTAEAVGKFQIKHGILKSSSDAGYGVVGPRTMATIDNNFIYRIGNTPNVLSDEQRMKIIERLRAIVEQVTLMQNKLKEQGGTSSN